MYGVAKKANIYSLKVFEEINGTCVGTWSGVLGAIAYAYGHAFLKGTISKSVINMSLSKLHSISPSSPSDLPTRLTREGKKGGPKLYVVDLAVNAAVAGGLTVVVAAGNQGVTIPPSLTPLPAPTASFLC